MSYVKMGLVAVLLAGTSTSAMAERAEVTANLSFRVGPGTVYPVIGVIPDGREVRIFGCIEGLDWCDVRWRGERGWVFADYLRYRQDNDWRLLPRWGASIDLPIVAFELNTYANRYYRDSPHYRLARRWSREHDRGHRWHDWDRDGREANRGDDGREYDRDRNRDAQEANRGDGDREYDRDRDERDAYRGDDDREYDRDRDRDGQEANRGDDDREYDRDRKGERQNRKKNKKNKAGQSASNRGQNPPASPQAEENANERSAVKADDEEEGS